MRRAVIILLLSWTAAARGAAPSESFNVAQAAPSELFNAAHAAASFELIDTAHTEAPSESFNIAQAAPCELFNATHAAAPFELIDTAHTEAPSASFNVAQAALSELFNVAHTAASSESFNVAQAAAPSELFNLAYTLDPQSRAVPSPLNTRLPVRLEELLLAPQIALPAAPAVSIPVSKAAARKDLWDRIRDGFGVPDLDTPLVDRWQAWYLARPLMLKAIIERSRRYLYHVVEELSKRGMPLELALLPMVESGYDPTAVSSAQAAGMWQFIPSTGRDYGLLRSADYDARRDIVASTAAALDYLQFLHETFGDWHLALAGYNWGENAVLKAVERNKGKIRRTDYLSLTLPEETRNYLPKFQALKNLVAYHHAFGFGLDPIPNEPYFTTVTTDHSLDLVVAARLSGAPLEEITSLNPARTGTGNGVGATRGNGGTGTTGAIGGTGTARGLVLPADKADKFISNFENYKNATPAKKPAKRRPTK